MYKLKIIISISIFSSLLIGTSVIKNQTRDIEKKIHNLSKYIYSKKKDFKESQLDFFYLSSPLIVEQKIRHIDINKYIPMDRSNIFSNLESFNELKNKYVNHEKKYK
tara:strand:- start:208 stop:528 length:321 start_codon:yes stop_codon:yes gene_type:complete